MVNVRIKFGVLKSQVLTEGPITSLRQDPVKMKYKIQINGFKGRMGDKLFNGLMLEKRWGSVLHGADSLDKVW